MKKLLYVLGGIVCCLIWSFSARADVIWEPQDSFFESHSSECNYVSRQYTANGPDGVVIVYKSPELAEVVDTWENGHMVTITHVYQGSDGIPWGIYDDFRGQCGWVPMDYMKLVYDGISFEEEYGDRIQNRQGEIDEKYLNTDIYFWNYPGSDIFIRITAEDHMPQYNQVFTDESGYTWGQIGYYFGAKSHWVCLEKPGADYAGLYPDGGPKRGEAAADSAQDQKHGWQDSAEYGSDALQENGEENTETSRITPRQDSRTMALTLAMVAAVVSVAAVLLWLLNKGKKRP